MSREWPLISGITVACLNKVGNLPSENERLAKWAMISQKTSLQRKTREVGIISMVEDLAGEERSKHHVASCVNRFRVQ